MPLPHTVKPIVLIEKNMVKPHLAQMRGRNSVVGPLTAYIEAIEAKKEMAAVFKPF